MLDNPVLMRRNIYSALCRDEPDASLRITQAAELSSVSAVLFLIGMWPGNQNGQSELSLILNKRSDRVRQPGDLCCPGGGVSERTDSIIGKLLKLPLSPLSRWPYWKELRTRQPGLADHFACLAATGLREGVEEMRLNPLGVDILGILPVQHLVMFKRMILPVVAWISQQKRFYPNWEVDKVLVIPFRDLTNPMNYARYRLEFNVGTSHRKDGETEDFPSFVHRDGETEELLWGATYRMTIGFLDAVFGFTPPSLHALPVIRRTIGESYLTGNF